MIYSPFFGKHLVWVLVVLVPSQDGWHLLAPAWSSPPASHGLVGGWPTRPEKWWSSSVGITIPNRIEYNIYIWKVIKFPTEWKNNPNVPNHQAVYRMIQQDKATYQWLYETCYERSWTFWHWANNTGEILSNTHQRGDIKIKQHTATNKNGRYSQQTSCWLSYPS